ncbi:hypothetical protein D1007_08757 [Hordeum vulgare]|nr:hypothetical protein D1007_08757 [Hordeum vulgare]
MSLSHSAPLYLFFDAPAWEEYWLHEDTADGHEFAAAGAKSVGNEDNSAGPRGCGRQLLGGGAQLPLKLPPRLQHPADWSAASSSATSPTTHTQAQLCMVPSWSPFASSTRHRDFDPFAAALEKVRRDWPAAPLPSRPMRRSRSLSPLRGAETAAANLNISHLGQKASRRPPQRSTRRRGVKHLLCWAATASSAAAPALGEDGVASYRRPRLLVCFGF